MIRHGTSQRRVIAEYPRVRASTTTLRTIRSRSTIRTGAIPRWAAPPRTMSGDCASLSASTSHPNLSLGFKLSISPDRGVDTSLRGGLIAGGSVYSFGAAYKDYTHTASAQFATNKAFSLGDVHVSSVAARARFTPSEQRGVPALRVGFTGNLAADVPVENYPPPGRVNLIGSLAGSLRLGSDLSVRGNVSGRVGLTIPVAEVRFSAQFRGPSTPVTSTFDLLITTQTLTSSSMARRSLVDRFARFRYPSPVSKVRRASPAENSKARTSISVGYSSSLGWVRA